MVDAVTITVNSVDRTSVIPFKVDARDTNSRIHIENVLPGIATCSLLLYDFSNSITFGDNDNILILDPTTPDNALFQGYVTRRKLHVEANYRIWEVSCTDLNSWMDLIIIGAPDGRHFLQDPPGVFTAYDPAAHTILAGDYGSIQRLFNTYASFLPVDARTFVETLSPTFPKNWIRWNTVTLRQALDELAAAVNTSIRFWIDPDWFFHWTVHPSPSIVLSHAPGPINRLFPLGPTLSTGPRTLTDGPSNGVTSINYDSFEIEYDDTGWADSVYVAGGTTYTYNKKTRKVKAGGSGWAKGIGPRGRQQILSAPNSHTPGVRDAIGYTALLNSQHVLVRGSCRVTVKFGGWFPGQSIRMTNAVAGLSNSTYPIQKVTTDFISGDGQRIVTLEWGDAPRGTLGYRSHAAKKRKHAVVHHSVRPGAKMTVTVSNAGPGPGGVVRVYAQATDPAGNAWHVADMTTTWSVQVYDTDCNDVTDTSAWLLSKTHSDTNIHGMAWTDLITSGVTGLTYYMTASCEIEDS